MGRTLIGNKVTSLPLSQGVGSQYSPVKASSSGATAASVPVPPPSTLTINGQTVTIDVRSSSGTGIAAILNGINGVSASVDGSGQLVVSGVNSISGSSTLRALLGI